MWTTERDIVLEFWDLNEYKLKAILLALGDCFVVSYLCYVFVSSLNTAINTWTGYWNVFRRTLHWSWLIFSKMFIKRTNLRKLSNKLARLFNLLDTSRFKKYFNFLLRLSKSTIDDLLSWLKKFQGFKVSRF